MVLGGQPTGKVIITPVSRATGVATVSPSELTFNRGNWDRPQTVIVTGVYDDTDEEGIATITHAVTGGGYQGLSGVHVAVQVIGVFSVRVTESGGSTVTTESGGTDTVRVVLDSQPTADVTIAVSSSDTSEGTVSPASLTFTSANWNTVQTITVTGVDDETDGERSTTITHAVSGGGYGSVGITGVSVTLTDNDTAGVTVSETGGGTATTEGGGSDTISVVLDSQPREQVSITVTSSDTGEGTVFPASLTFTPSTWNQPTPVTVTGVDDEVDDGDQAYRIVLAAAASSDATYNGLDASDVAVTNIDDDEAAIVSPAVFEVPENQGAVGTVLAVGGEAVTYAIVGGVDREQFEVDPATGVLTFRAVPDFETPADEASTDPVNDAGNNQYIVGVTAVVQTGEGEKTLEQTIVVTVTDGNDPPVAHAGEGLTVAQGVRVTLDGSGSRDPEGEGLSYAWEPVEAAAAPKIKLEGAETVRPSFTAPSDLAKTIALTFALTVTDTHGERSAAAAVTIRVLVSVAEQDGHVRFAPLRAGEVVVSRGQRITLEVEQGAPAGLGLTLPLEQLGGEAITTITVKRAPTDLPAQPGYRRVSPAVDISLNKGRLSAFPGGATATVCLPLGEPADGVAVYHYEAGTARWAALPLVGGAQPSAVCGATSKFSPFQAFVPIVSDTARAEVSTHWLGRFGRTMASQAVAVIGERLMGGPAGLGTRVTLGGRPVTLRAAAGDDTAGPGARGEWGGGGRGDELAGSGAGLGGAGGGIPGGPAGAGGGCGVRLGGGGLRRSLGPGRPGRFA